MCSPFMPAAPCLSSPPAMALVFEIATRSRPDVEIAASFAELERRNKPGGLVRLTWLIGRRRASVVTVEGPVQLEPGDLRPRLADAAPDAAWLVRIHVSRDDAGLARLARAVARQLAEVFEGAAYDASLARLLWPRRPPSVPVLKDF